MDLSLVIKFMRAVKMENKKKLSRHVESVDLNYHAVSNNIDMTLLDWTSVDCTPSSFNYQVKHNFAIKMTSFCCLLIIIDQLETSELHIRMNANRRFESILFWRKKDFAPWKLFLSIISINGIIWNSIRAPSLKNEITAKLSLRHFSADSLIAKRW